MKKVLVIGASGLIGTRFTLLGENKMDITPVDEKVLDITDKASVKKYFKENSFDSVLNLAAITNVDGAEKERGDETGLTWRLNVLGPKNLAEICKEKDIFLVQISTDFVFKGTNEEPGPYSEDSPLPESADGLGWYGWSKNRAEDAVKKSGAKTAIVRVAYPFYAAEFEGKLDFAKNYLKLFDEGKLFPIFTDQTLSVLNVDFLTEPLTKIIDNKMQGTFHVVSKDVATPFDFVEYLLKKARNTENATQKGLMSEFLKTPGRTPRPRLGGLKTQNTEESLGMEFKTWRQMVDYFVEGLSS